MYKIGPYWINTAALTHVYDDPEADRIVVFFPGQRTVTLLGETRQQLLYVLEKEATEIR
jgi:hypothetical protein